MNRLVLIGNGFDLAHGLKTRYSDFILWYLNNAFSHLHNEFYYEDELIRLSTPAKIPFDEFKSIGDFRKHLYNYPQIRYEYEYLFFDKLLSQPNTSKWVDIESFYYESLVENYNSISQGLININYNDKLIELNECFEIIKKKLVEYLNTIAIDNKIFNDEIKDHLVNVIKPNVADHSLMHILNFNYTSTIEIYKKNLTSVKHDINYIHGKLNDAENPVIFGYGDEIDSYYQKIENLNENEFLMNFKSFGYFKTPNYTRFSGFINSDLFKVLIMGHSCGLSDRVLLNSIFEHKNCAGIQILYYDKGNSENDFMEKTQEISRHFKAESKGRMRNLIVNEKYSKPLVKA